MTRRQWSFEHYVDQSCRSYNYDVARQRISRGQISSSANEDSRFEGKTAPSVIFIFGVLISRENTQRRCTDKASIFPKTPQIEENFS